MIGKAAIGVGVLSALCATCYAIINPIVNWTSADADYWNEGTIGKTYGKYFLSANANRYWWNDSVRLSTTSNDKFKNAIQKQQGYGSSNEYLNMVCEEVYKLTNTNSIDNNSSTTDQSKFSLSKIWEYCAPYWPSNMSMSSGYSGKLGSDNTNKTLFVDTSVWWNDWFWELRKDDFWYLTGKLSKSNIKGTDTTNNAFKKLEKSNDTSLQAFKDACEEAYKKETSDSHQNKEDALLFCSIKLDIQTSSKK